MNFILASASERRQELLKRIIKDFSIMVSEFDESIFKEKITEILVPEFNKLVFVLCDGHLVEKVWQDRSRRESWTDEMRQAAREKAKGVKEQWR